MEGAGGLPDSVNIILYVRDQAAAGRFYRAVLDAEPTLDVPGMTEFALGQGVVLGLMPEAGIRALLGDALPAQASGAMRAEVYLRVADPATAHRRAVDAGARELSPLEPRSWGDEAAYSLDPDGYVLVFGRRLE